MKRSLKTLLTTFTLVSQMVTGCASPYRITFSNGSTDTAVSKPEHDTRRNVWIYKDTSGHLNTVSGLRVVEVVPESEKKTQFGVNPGR